MVVRWIEKPAFSDLMASAEGTQVTLHGKVVGTSDRNFAEAVALSNTAAQGTTNHGFVYRRSVNLVQVAYDSFDAEIEYGRKNEVGDYTWDFDTTGGTVHITQAKESITRYYSGGSELGSAAATNVPKHNGAIGVDKTASGIEVKGTDIVIPAMRINLNFRHPQGQITLPWAMMLSDLTGKVNSTTFLNRPAGEVLFLGARGSDGSQAEATVSYAFAISKNSTGLTIGAIANIAKKGWEYLWITYKDEVSASNPAKQPEFVYVERVYDTDDFATKLGFG